MSADDRELHSGERMTELEAMMWAAERDPMLSSAMGSVFVLDQAPDFERFTASMERASRTLLRLRERVEEGFGIAPPRWVIDADFDIADHVISVKLPKPAGREELLDLASELFSEPFEPGKPLWKFMAVKGRRNGKNAIAGAILMKLHHSVSDGIGALRLAEMYLDLERDPAPVDDADAPPAPTPSEERSPLTGALDDVDHVVRSQLARARSAAAEVSLWGADPDRAKSTMKSVADLSGSLLQQFMGSDLGDAGSELWANRSAGRRLEVFELPLDTLKAAAAGYGGTINDAFVAGSVLAANGYHEARSADPGTFNVSFIMSTREDEKAGGNAFAPVPFTVPVDRTSDHRQFELVKAAMHEKREAAGLMSDAVSLTASLVNGLPPALLSRTGRSRSARIDWGTSNLRGAPFSIYSAGAKIEHMYPVGPTGGTAFNLTAMSYNGVMHFGVYIDTASIDDPAELRDRLQAAYESMAAGPG